MDVRDVKFRWLKREGNVFFFDTEGGWDLAYFHKWSNTENDDYAIVELKEDGAIMKIPIDEVEFYFMREA